MQDNKFSNSCLSAGHKLKITSTPATATTVAGALVIKASVDAAAPTAGDTNLNNYLNNSVGGASADMLAVVAGATAAKVDDGQNVLEINTCHQ